MQTLRPTHCYKGLSGVIYDNILYSVKYFTRQILILTEGNPSLKTGNTYFLIVIDPIAPQPVFQKHKIPNATTEPNNK